MLLLVPITAGLLTAGCARTVHGTAAAPTARPRRPPPRPRPSRRTSSASSYKVPKGFVEQHGYRPLTPLEAKRVSHFFPLASAPTGHDVLSLSLYTLPATHLVDTAAAQLARVKAYNRKTKARLYTKIMPATLFGRPAYNESAERARRIPLQHLVRVQRPASVPGHVSVGQATEEDRVRLPGPAPFRGPGLTPLSENRQSLSVGGRTLDE